MATEINIKSSTVEKGLDLAKEFLSKLIGPSVDELGLMWSDNVKLWRLKLQIKNLAQVQAMVEANHIDIRQVNLKVLVPYMENVSLEEDESLQDIWANLFVNYIDASRKLNATVYPNILGQLSSNDVKVLKASIDKGVDLSTSKPNIIGTEEDRECVANLVRLGLIQEELEFSTYETGSNRGGFENLGIEEISSGRFYITAFGDNFINACQRE